MCAFPLRPQNVRYAPGLGRRGRTTMRIAIVGATGMLGHHTAFAAGHELLVYRNSQSLERLGDLRYEARHADLDDLPALTRALQGADAPATTRPRVPGAKKSPPPRGRSTRRRSR